MRHGIKGCPLQYSKSFTQAGIIININSIEKFNDVEFYKWSMQTDDKCLINLHLRLQSAGSVFPRRHRERFWQMCGAAIAVTPFKLSWRPRK